jgi:subtilase family serine protease
LKLISSDFINSRRLAAGAILAAVLFFTPLARPQQAAKLLRDHVRPAVLSGQAAVVGALPAAQTLKPIIMMALRDEDGLNSFLDQLNDPNSPGYHRYLTVDEFTARFAPTEKDFQSVIAFAKANGFKVLDTPRNRMIVPLEGSVAQIESAFHVTMRTYRHPTENRIFYSPDREPTLFLNVPVVHIFGLNDFNLPHSVGLQKASLTGPATSLTVGSGPGGQLLGSDLRAAYYSGKTLTGAGQSVGLFGTAYDISDVALYFNTVQQPFSPAVVQNVAVDGADPTCNGCSNAEVSIDIVRSYSMAPGVDAIYEFVGTGNVDTFNAMATHNPLPLQLSSSISYDPETPKLEEPIFKEFAAQGQSFFQASGDSGAYTPADANGSSYYPDESVYATPVGGTDLTTNGPGGAWRSETGWIGSGGGPSPDGTPIPTWQKKLANSYNNASATLRNLPDVAAEANTDNYYCDQGACSGGLGGTSLSAPLWAGYIALVNQRAAVFGKPSVGLVGPVVSTIGRSAGYNNNFHDITAGSDGCCGQSVFYNSVAGYDLVTGWGTPNSGLIDALAGVAELIPGFALSVAPGLSGSPAVVIPQGGAGKTVATIASLNGFSSATELSTSLLPTGVTDSFSANPVTITAAATAQTGSFTIPVIGSAGSAAHSVNMALTVYSSAPLSGYNVTGIYTNGSMFLTGLDGDGYAYSASLLGPSLVWDGTTFAFGPANSPDVYNAEPVALPAGAFSSLKLLATGVNGSQQSQPFVITYTDGTTTTFEQSLSDWFAPQSFPGESTAASYAYRLTGDGTLDFGPFLLYGYQFALTSGKTLKSITLPSNRNVLVLAIVPVE